MKRIIEKIKLLARDEEGATMVEYAIMVALIAVVGIVVVQTLGGNVADTFDNVNVQLDAANVPTTTPATGT